MAEPIERITTPAGDSAWHITGHPDVKALLGDQRLGRAHPDPATAGRYSADDIAGRPAGGSETEYSEHAWWRKAMNKVFSPAGLERWTPAVEKIARQVAGQLALRPTPADLNDAYSTPLASQVMCTVLGVPTSDIERFREWTEEGAQATDLERSLGGIRLLMSYARDLVTQRRGRDGNDIISVLLAAGTGPPGIHEGRVVKLVAGMLAFGRETPASVIDSGALLLLTHPEQRRLLQDEPSLMPRAVEEILRHFKPPAATDKGLLRYAHEDLEASGNAIRAGDMVLLDLMAANHDRDVFPEPGRFIVDREPNPHLTFGHGFYMCNFTRLARAEIGIALGTLLEQFPDLDLAAPPSQLQLKSHLRTGGLERLPVTW
jgi:pentalenolactone synthase